MLVARKSIQAIGHIALRLPARANTCVEKLLSLLNMEIDYVTSETLVATTSESLSCCVEPLHHVGPNAIHLTLYTL